MNDKKQIITLLTRITALLLTAVIFLSACGTEDTSSKKKKKKKAESSSSQIESAEEFTSSEEDIASDTFFEATPSDTEKKKHDRPWVGNNSRVPSYGSDSSIGDTSSTPSDDTEKAEVESSLHDSLIVIFQNESKEDFMPCVAYYKDGEISDMMFDSFVMAWIWQGYLSSPTKDEIERYFRQLFRKKQNMDALNEAVGEAKEALNRPNYKANVWIGYWESSESIGTNYGAVNGKKLDLTVQADRDAATKWQIDEAIRLFNEQGYENLQLAGFHCISESYDTSNASTLATLQYFTHYVSSLGLKTNMGPYYNAAGWDKHELMGFDWNTLSPNYFKCGSPNAGGIERLAEVGEKVKNLNIGMAMELEQYNKTAVGVLKEYMKGGIDYGYMNVYHTWYMVNGAKGVNYIYGNEDSEIRSAYDEMYRYINRTLTADSILLY